MTCHVLICCL